MRAFRGIGKCVCVYERGRKGASKQLMDWCSLLFFSFLLLGRDTFTYVQYSQTSE